MHDAFEKFATVSNLDPSEAITFEEFVGSAEYEAALKLVRKEHVDSDICVSNRLEPEYWSQIAFRRTMPASSTYSMVGNESTLLHICIDLRTNNLEKQAVKHHKALTVFLHDFGLYELECDSG
jgi:hypothetical protein